MAFYIFIFYKIYKSTVVEVFPRLFSDIDS